MTLYFNLFLLLLISFTYTGYSQVENISIANPVYDFLIRAEAKGLLEHFSTSDLPLQKKEIVNALKIIRAKSEQLSTFEIKSLEKFEKYFGIISQENLVVFYSEMDTNQVFSLNFFNDNAKYFYHYADSNKNISILPLASAETHFLSSNEHKKVALGNLGIRVSGTLSNCFGYSLQATNGAIFAGDRTVALLDPHLSQSLKFSEMNSDFDFTESHVAFQSDWFNVSIGRQTRRLGSGINTSLFISDNAPPFTAITLGAKFKSFEYKFTHAALLTYYMDSTKLGFNAIIPQKYNTMHRFALRPQWGEIAFWESIVYSKRDMDLEYLNPLSFFKSLEHALRDRDNSLMGGDITIRPLNNFEIKGSYILDDIIFSNIGKNYWNNKSAFNVGLWYSSDFSTDFGIEYVRVEPYTFTHFDSLNSYTNDQKLIGTSLMPNSEEYSAALRFWWGQRYPLVCKVAFRRHGENVYSSDGKLIKNVGGDYMITHSPTDSQTVHLLDGKLVESFLLNLTFGYEIFRDLSVHLDYSYNTFTNDSNRHLFKIIFKYEDF
jgi:hypothetical protein